MQCNDDHVCHQTDKSPLAPLRLINIIVALRNQLKACDQTLHENSNHDRAIETPVQGIVA